MQATTPALTSLNAAAQPGSQPAVPETPTGEPYPPANSPTLAPPITTPLPLTGIADQLVELAKTRLADKLGIGSQSISLFNVQPRDWPDESLGCPIGGQNYAQVITPGYLIELEVGGSIYSFHTNQATRVILCGVEPPHEIFNPP